MADFFLHTLQEGANSMQTVIENNNPAVTPEVVLASQTLPATEVAEAAEAKVEKPLVMEELVIEEVSIDGMCGVY